VGKVIDARAVTDTVLTDELWSRLEPLIPVRQRRFRYPGRARASDRAALEGILFAARTGVTWNALPTAAFGASGATCWRRLKEWHEAGVWQQLHELILAELRAAGRLDLSAAIVDSSHLRALKGGTSPAPARSTGGNRNDITQLLPLLDAVPSVRGLVGRPLRRPRRIFADRGYDFDKYRRLLRSRGVTPHIARRNTGHGSGLGTHRWPVERTIAWLHAFKKLRLRTERRADIHQALISLACSVICLRQLILN